MTTDPGALTESEEASVDADAGAGADAVDAATLPPDGGGPRPPAAVPDRTDGAPAPDPRPSARLLTIVIVFTTLSVATVGYLANRTSTRSTSTADNAGQLGLAASRDLQTERQQAQSDYFAYLVGEAEQHRSAAAFWEAAVNDEWAGLQTASQSVADQIAKDLSPDLGAQSATGPVSDPTFPSHFFTIRTLFSTSEQAQAEAQNQASNSWSRAAGSYTVVLTIFAIALFLFGYALSLFGLSRIGFAALGLILLLVGISSASWTATHPPHLVSDQAITDFVDGEHAAAIAVQPLDYQSAIDKFGAAIKRSPNFGQAYWHRSQAEDLRGSEELGQGLVSNVAPVWADLVLADERKAYSLGVREPYLVSDLGFEIYRQWLRSPSGSVPGDALRFDRQAIVADPTDPIAEMNLGVALLADGNTAQAVRSYQVAIGEMLSQSANQHDELAGGMTDLDNLAGSTLTRARPQLVNQVAQMKERLAGSLALGSNAAPSDAGVDLHLDATKDIFVSPTALQVTVPDTDWDPASHDLRDEPIAVVWYGRKTPEAGAAPDAWNAISESTGWGKITFGYDSTSHTYYATRSLLGGSPSQCVPSGDYRVEIYDGGHLAYSSPTDTFSGTADLVGRSERDMGLGVCVPGTWTLKAAPTAQLTGGPNQGATAQLAGMSLGYASPDGTEGAYLWRLYPTNGAFATTDATHVVKSEMDYTVNFLAHNQTLPSDVALDNSQPPQSYGDFLGGSSTLSAWYHSSSRSGVTVRVGAGRTSDNGVVIGLVYGPDKDFATSDALGVKIFATLTSL